MPTYLSPGVYVEETTSGARPIEGVGTAVAAFVGLCGAGPFNTPTLVTNWSQFTSIFGDFVEGSYLHHSVYGYLQNGGGACYIVRIGGNGAAAPVARGELTATTGGAGGSAGAGIKTIYLAPVILNILGKNSGAIYAAGASATTRWACAPPTATRPGRPYSSRPAFAWRGPSNNRGGEGPMGYARERGRGVGAV